MKFKYALRVDSKSFPHRIAVLNGRIEGADARFVAMDELAVDVND